MSKDVFFLGAGFSIALANSCVTNGFRYPSLTELTELVKDRFTKASLATHLNEISSKYTENIESLLTYLSTDFPWQNQQMIHLDKALYFELVKNIRKTFVQLDRNCEYNFEPFNGFSKYIIENKIPLITLNYDILLEKMLFSNMTEGYQRVNSYKGFYKQAILNLSSRNADNTAVWASYEDDEYGNKLPTIHKLHGSVNWLWSATNSSEPVYCTMGMEHESLRKDLSEYIIPPVLDKTKFYDHNIIKSIWADAYTTLKNADRVFIIGFSFPATDLSVKFLFNSAFSDRSCEPKIYVINTSDAINPESKNYLKDSYDDIFSDMYVNYDYCCDNSLEKFVQKVIEPKLEVANAN